MITSKYVANIVDNHESIIYKVLCGKTASSFAFRSLFDHLTTMMFTGIDIERPYTLLAKHTQTQKIKKKIQ